MGARVLLRDIEWAFSSKAWLIGRPSCQRRENKGASKLVISTARTAKIHHVKVFLKYTPVSGCKAEKRESYQTHEGREGENKNGKGKYQTHEPMMEIYGNLSRTITSVLHGFQRKSQGFLQIFVVLASLHV